MKCKIILSPEREEEILIYAHEKTPLIEKIEALAKSDDQPTLFGYSDDSATRLSPAEICCVAIEGGRLYAYTATQKLLLKQRLYEVEAILDNGFVKINQSCLVKIDQIKQFKTSIGGALTVTLSNGFCDYVSRRQLKIVKERIF